MFNYCKQLHELFTKEIRNRLQDRDICWRLEYAGSAYEGVKVRPWVRRYDNDSDLEFDVMVILQCNTNLLQVRRIR